MDNVIVFPVERRLERIRSEQQAASPTGVSVSQSGSFNFSVTSASGVATSGGAPPPEQLLIPSASHPPQPSRRVDDQSAWVLLGAGRVRHRLLSLAYDDAVGWRADAACGRSGAPDYSKWSGEKCQRCRYHGWM